MIDDKYITSFSAGPNNQVSNTYLANVELRAKNILGYKIHRNIK